MFGDQSKLERETDTATVHKNNFLMNAERVMTEL